jgi:hypothetical protein
VDPRTLAAGPTAGPTAEGATPAAAVGSRGELGGQTERHVTTYLRASTERADAQTPTMLTLSTDETEIAKRRALERLARSQSAPALTVGSTSLTLRSQDGDTVEVRFVPLQRSKRSRHRLQPGDAHWLKPLLMLIGLAFVAFALTQRAEAEQPTQVEMTWNGAPYECHGFIGGQIDDRTPSWEQQIPVFGVVLRFAPPSAK